jgi:hypothetical protein
MQPFGSLPTLACGRPRTFEQAMSPILLENAWHAPSSYRAKGVSRTALVNNPG